MVTIIGLVFRLRIFGVVGPISFAPTLGSRSFLDQPLIITPLAEDLGTDLDLGCEVEDHRVSTADRDTIAGLRA
jgi:hypothetical protein